MTKQKISCVYFDVFGTLTSIAGIAENDVSRFGKSLDDLRDYLAPYAEMADHGDITFTEYQKKYSEFFGKGLDYLPLHVLPRFQPIKETHALVTLLDALGIPMGILSDVSRSALRQTINTGAVPYVNYFAIIESNKHGKRKSGGLIEHATRITKERLNISTGQILLIDDAEKNIQAAEDFGWQAFKFDPNHPRTSIRELLNKYSLFN